MHSTVRIHMRNECNRLDHLLDQGKCVLSWFGTFCDEHLYQLGLTNFIKVDLFMQHRPGLEFYSSLWGRHVGVPVKTAFLKLSNIYMWFNGK